MSVRPNRYSRISSASPPQASCSCLAVHSLTRLTSAPFVSARTTSSVRPSNLPFSTQLHCSRLEGVSEKGFITHLAPLSDPTSTHLLSSPSQPAIRLDAHAFLLPTFTDLHLHAPQYLYAGTGLDSPLMEWLDKYAYKAEESLDGDKELAGRVYGRLVERLMVVGTGCAVLFGTIGVETK
jgi:guanine deaminase